MEETLEVNGNRKIDKPLVELHYKMTRRGKDWQAFVRCDGEWAPLLADYSLATSAIGALEAQLQHDVFKRNGL